MIRVIDNFLPLEELKKMQHTMIDSATLPWYWNSDITNDPTEERGQFTHMFYRENMGRSDTFAVVAPILERLFYTESATESSIIIYKAKANLNTKESENNQLGEYHVDYSIPCKTAIFYVNTNNGYTRFLDSGDIIDSKENRLIVFDSHLKHVGFTCTDEKVRVIININYVTYT